MEIIQSLFSYWVPLYSLGAFVLPCFVVSGFHPFETCFFSEEKTKGDRIWGGRYILTGSWEEQKRKCALDVSYILEKNILKKNPFPFKIQKSPFKIQSLSSLGSCENQMSKKERTRAQSQSDQSQPQWQEYNVLNVQCLGTTLSFLGSFKGLGSLLYSALYSTQSLSSRLKLAPPHTCCPWYSCQGTASPNAGGLSTGQHFHPQPFLDSKIPAMLSNAKPHLFSPQ